MSSTLEWMIFQRIFGYGTTRGQKLLERFGSPERLLAAYVPQMEPGEPFTKTELSKLSERSRYEQWAERTLERCWKLGCQVLTPDSPQYPARLRNIYSFPAVLYVLGELGEIDEQPAIAVVGTRKCTDYGRRAAEEFSWELARRGVIIVSGLALGIDSISQEAALKAGGRTIAVLGNGIDTVYPAQHRPLHRAILEHGGAVVSEYPPQEGAQPFFFPLRNRIISGLSLGTLVVEGTRHSGSLITAGHAVTQNRDVFAVPGSIYSPQSAGPNWLIGQGALPVSSWEEILAQYPWLTFSEPKEQPPLQISFDNPTPSVYNGQKGASSRPQKQKKACGSEAPKGGKTEAPSYLTENQRRIFELLGEEPVSADRIVEQTGLPVPVVLANLTQLEIFGLVRTHPGRRFSR
ncbi:DNA-processing protein DprA [Angelakisella massiliensis]|uniref:DNA-processing protein DprA n=1 Tax=Angelakisella massiliensis TaxID=1871018 RepID=UPI0008F885C3|nr:DNA-processing protein DprA [Angelakisella massiliensis]